jgi:hypothetical protein
MSDSHALQQDTSAEARRIQRARWAGCSSPRKFEMIGRLCGDVRALALAGIRRRFENATPREQRLRLGALTIERRLMIDAFGWDPAREGR